ncbi:MAG: hypothetical protein K0R24_336 [Gammaproteobacteria bacterium]|jgi:conjugal transfer pilus assembly protein TraF|nr:hypothetical protein [Gammaproteobacteria bacterium]
MHKKIIYYAVFWGLLSNSFSLRADETRYFNHHEQGWHWYNEFQKEKEYNEEGVFDPTEQMNAVRATIKNALNKAVLSPNKENVKNYLMLQNQLMNRSSEFQHYWEAVLLENPELDYSMMHPTNTIAQQVEYSQQKNKENNLIEELAKKSGLFFFYRGTCGYCQKFAPIVKDFADTYGIHVVAITTDGMSLPEFPHSYRDQGQAEKFHVTAEPALFAVDPYTQKAFPIAYGLTSQADIKKNILNIATRYEGDVK